MIAFYEFDGIMPAARMENGSMLPEELYKVRINLEEVLDYADGTGTYMLEYDGLITIVNYHNGFCRYIAFNYNNFHTIMMKYMASKTRYIIQTKFN
jgi:hypothetical protein